MLPIQKTSVSSYNDVAKQADSLRRLFDKYGVKISPDLNHLTEATKELAEKWTAGKRSELQPATLWEALSIHRIADAILQLDGHARAKELLEKLSQGDINMIAHDRTVARDTFWEIEVWHYIRRAGLTTDLIDPPDIIWTVNAQNTGIACKRIYSEKHIQRILSEAVHQIEATTGFGIAAFQLEDVRIPKGKITKTATRAEAVDILQGINQDFFKEHKRHFLKYFSKDRLTAALAATSCFAVTDISRNVNTQWSIWTHPDINAEHKARVTQLYQAISGGTSRP